MLESVTESALWVGSALSGLADVMDVGHGLEVVLAMLGLTRLRARPPVRDRTRCRRCADRACHRRRPAGRA